jgi:hypothetical protein
LEAAFVLLEFSSPSRRIFIGSHSLPPSLVCRIGLSAVRVVSIAATASAAGPPVGPMVAASAVAATAARVTVAAAGAAVRDDLTIAVATL